MDAAPGDVAKALLAADAEVLSGAPAAGFDRLIALLRTTAGEEKDALRERLVGLFGLFEPADPQALAARGAMASALY